MNEDWRKILADETNILVLESVKKWIQSAIQKPGSLRKALRAKAGRSIPKPKLKDAAKGSGITAKRARLALLLGKFHR